MADFETHSYDVVVIGAGGAGMRAAIEASGAGVKTALVCKSLLGKAHTVMAEGGIAAAMGNVYPEDNWKVHFRDTMRGGKFLNNWRMAQLHAQEAPERVWELEDWGALFDRTPDGKISQRDFGGHRYARLAHTADRSGLEMIRTLQQGLVGQGQVDVFMECTIVDLLLDDSGNVRGAFGYWRPTGEFIAFTCKAVVMATGGIGRAWKVTSNSWEYSGDGHAMAVRAGAELIDMEFIQFHPTGMVWPPSIRGALVTESVRGDGGVLTNKFGDRFMFNYVPDLFRKETAETEEEADLWYKDHSAARRTPDLLPRDEVARAINAEVKAGRGSPHGGVYLDVSSRLSPDVILKRLSSMYHQFKELADVDITKEPMEIAPTCHYTMGGIRVDAETEAATTEGLFACGESAGGMHGANRLGGNSLSDLLVFGKRAGEAAAQYAKGETSEPQLSDGQITDIARHTTQPFERVDGENPFTVLHDMQETLHNLVGIIRTESELTEAVEKLRTLRDRAEKVKVVGTRAYNPGWNTAIDLRNMLLVAEACTKAALARRESRGGHTRDDFPATDPEFGKINHAVRFEDGEVTITPTPLPEMPDELRKIIEEIPE